MYIYTEYFSSLKSTTVEKDHVNLYMANNFFAKISL